MLGCDIYMSSIEEIKTDIKCCPHCGCTRFMRVMYASFYISVDTKTEVAADLQDIDVSDEEDWQCCDCGEIVNDSEMFEYLTNLFDEKVS